MPAPTNNRQALKRELAELPEQIAGYRRELEATPSQNTARRERLAWQIRRDQRRMAEIQARLSENRRLSSQAIRLGTAEVKPGLAI